MSDEQFHNIRIHIGIVIAWFSRLDDDPTVRDVGSDQGAG
jgi:hypothetical protein